MPKARKNKGMVKDPKRGRRSGRGNALNTFVSDEAVALVQEASLRRALKRRERPSQSVVMEDLIQHCKDWLKKYE